MINKLKSSTDFSPKSKKLHEFNLLNEFDLSNTDDIKNNPDFIAYNTEKIIPAIENRNHFASLASVLSVENGYFGTRSCLEECNEDISSGATYIAGIYTVNDDNITDKLAVMPDWTRLCIFIENDPLDLVNNQILEHKRCFDVKRGVSTRKVRLKDSKGRITSFETEKFASLEDKHTAGQAISVTPQNYSGKIRIRTGIDGNVVNVEDAVFERFVSSDFIALNIDLPEKQFKNGEINFARQISMTKKTCVQLKNDAYSRLTGYDGQYAFEEYEINAQQEQKITINSLVSIVTNLDTDAPKTKNYRKLAENPLNYYEKAFNEHILIMQCRLNDAGIVICGDVTAQRYANYAVARLIMAGENNGEKSSITARTLTGPSYAGHVFWDNEIFDLPFFIFNMPEAAKKMLMYRYNTLEGAKENRRIENEEYNKEYKGARFAWESTFSGLERTPLFVTDSKGNKIRIFTGTNEKHITPDVAYAVYKYWLATKDDEFLCKYGAEIIFETARYSGSILEEGDDGKLHARNVIGPDEYHEEVEINPINGYKEGVHDNAYTNVLIQYNLEIAIKIAKYLEKKYNQDYKKLKTKINLEEKEIKCWIKDKDRVYLNYNHKTGVILQFNGYDKLKEVNLSYFKEKYGEVNAQKFDQALKLESCLNKHIDADKNNYKVIKQPDVVMLMAMFPEKYSYEIQEANYNEYEPKTSHGSSLSAGIHSLVAGRTDKKDDAYKYYLDTGGMDIDDIMGNAANGIHAASLGATWQALVCGFGGMQLRENCLLVNPNVPDFWNLFKFNIKLQGQSIKVLVKKEIPEQERLFISVEENGSQKIPVKLNKEGIKELYPGKVYSATRVFGEWKWDSQTKYKDFLITETLKSIGARFKAVLTQ